MTKQERLNWLINIGNSAEVIQQEIGYETVAAVLGRYGAKNINELPDNVLPDAFSELYAIEVDVI